MTRVHLFATAVGAALPAAMLLGACASDDGPALSVGAREGRRIAADAGCMSCHGAEGVGGVGPTWVGLAGSMVELADGRTVVADRSYLGTAITDPTADVVVGYTVAMPPNDLESDEVEAVVKYLEELQ